MGHRPSLYAGIMYGSMLHRFPFVMFFVALSVLLDRGPAGPGLSYSFSSSPLSSYILITNNNW